MTSADRESCSTRPAAACTAFFVPDLEHGTPEGNLTEAIEARAKQRASARVE